MPRIHNKKNHWLSEYRDGKIHPRFEGKNLKHSWKEKAACKGMDTNIFFPSPTDSNLITSEAKKICESCPVQKQCLDYSVKVMEHYGIWGGGTMHDRRKIRSKLKLAG